MAPRPCQISSPGSSRNATPHHQCDASCLYRNARSLFDAGEVVNATFLLVAADKGVGGEQHGRIEINIAEVAQTGDEVRGETDGQTRFDHGPNHQPGVCGTAQGGDVQRLHDAGLHQLNVDATHGSHSDEAGDSGGAGCALVGEDRDATMLRNVAQALEIVLVDRLLDHEWANVTVVQRFQAEQRLVRRVALIGVECDGQVGRTLADSLDALDIILQVAANLNLNAGNAFDEGVLSQLIGAFGRDERNTDVCFDLRAGPAEEDVKRHTVRTCESIQQSHFHACTDSGLRVENAFEQL